MRFGRLREEKNLVPLPEIEREYSVVHSFGYSLVLHYCIPEQDYSTFHAERETSENNLT